MGGSLLLIFLTLFIVALYRRYGPVKGVLCLSVDQVSNHLLIVDLRDYNEINDRMFRHALHIPVAYIKRQLSSIPRQPLHVVAQDVVEKNIGIRLLRRYGYEVKSYSIAACDCRTRRRANRWNTIKKSKTA
ncbi:rhodanese [Geobacillus subterraneus]|nr:MULTISPECIES: rhodanese [Geobacillus]WPZ20102.1 rhodanese [Geobacillus subterraneus]